MVSGARRPVPTPATPRPAPAPPPPRARSRPMLARAAIAAGVDGLFLECHPDPKNAKSDAATMLGLDAVEPLLTSCVQIAELRKNWA